MEWELTKRFECFVQDLTLFWDLPHLFFIWHDLMDTSLQCWDLRGKVGIIGVCHNLTSYGMPIYFQDSQMMRCTILSKLTWLVDFYTCLNTWLEYAKAYHIKNYIDNSSFCVLLLAPKVTLDCGKRQKLYAITHFAVSYAGNNTWSFGHVAWTFRSVQILLICLPCHLYGWWHGAL